MKFLQSKSKKYSSSINTYNKLVKKTAKIQQKKHDFIVNDGNVSKVIDMVNAGAICNLQYSKNCKINTEQTTKAIQQFKGKERGLKTYQVTTRQRKISDKADTIGRTAKQTTDNTKPTEISSLQLKDGGVSKIIDMADVVPLILLHLQQKQQENSNKVSQSNREKRNRETTSLEQFEFIVVKKHHF